MVTRPWRFLLASRTLYLPGDLLCSSFSARLFGGVSPIDLITSTAYVMESECHTLNFLNDEKERPQSFTDDAIGQINKKEPMNSRRRSLPAKAFGCSQKPTSGVVVKSLHFTNSSRKNTARDRSNKQDSKAHVSSSNADPKSMLSSESLPKSARKDLNVHRPRPFVFSTRKPRNATNSSQAGVEARTEWQTSSESQKGRLTSGGNAVKTEAKNSPQKKLRPFVVRQRKPSDKSILSAMGDSSKNLQVRRMSTDTKVTSSPKKDSGGKRNLSKPGVNDKQKKVKDEGSSQVRSEKQKAAGEAVEGKVKDMPNSKPQGGQKQTVLPPSLLKKVSETVKVKPEQVLTPLPEVTDPQVCEKSANQWRYKEKKRSKKKKNQKRKFELKDEKKEETGEPEEKKVFKQHPNYFLAIQITNPEIHTKLHLIQQHVMRQVPLLTSAMVPLPTLHFTLMVLYLHDQTDVDRAIEALDGCKPALSEFITQPIRFTVANLGDFRNSVVFSRLKEGQDCDSVQKVADTVRQCFSERGLQSLDKRDFTPHLTIMKLSRASYKTKKSVKKIDPALYEAFRQEVIGEQTAMSVQLCAMRKPKDKHGYYQVEHQIPLVPADYTPPQQPCEFQFSDTSSSVISTVSRTLVSYVLRGVQVKLLLENRLIQAEAERDGGQHVSENLTPYLVWRFMKPE